MLFNINNAFSKSNSGIESAQFNRFKVFMKEKTPFKLVTIAWNPEENHLLKDVGLYGIKLNDEQYVNMFDFFQNATTNFKQKMTVEDFSYGVRGQQLNLSFNNEYHKVEVYIKADDDSDVLIARLDFFKNDEDDELTSYEDCSKLQIRSIEMFDYHGNLYAVDLYDSRGFLSLRQMRNPNGSIQNEQWYTPDGKATIRKIYRHTKEKNDDGTEVLKGTQWVVADYDGSGSIQTFNTEIDMQTYFFNELNKKYFSTKEPNIFVLDRSHVGQESLLELELPAFTVFHFHNSQAGDVKDEVYSMMNNHYEYGLYNLNRYDASIVATPEQKRDIEERLTDLTSKVYQIPVGTVKNDKLKEKRVKMSDRIPHSIVMTARVAPEKQIEDVVKAISLIKDEFPDIILNVYGYIDPSNNQLEKRRVDYLVDKYHLEDNVKIHGYAQDTSAIQKQHQIYALSSYMEGFNIALMEGLSNGDVGVSYDVNYGPEHLVANEENGYIVPTNDYRQLAEKIRYLFNNEDVLQKMSDNAYDRSNMFSEDEIAKKWDKLISDSKKDWSQRLLYMKYNKHNDYIV